VAAGTTVDRPGLRALFDCARDGDVILVHTLDRLSRTVRDTLNLIHDLPSAGWSAQPGRPDAHRLDPPG
jgi:DNA invertase Pin-like site-specific DNA recombinase